MFEQKDILLVTPPFTQLNTPYPATAYIKGFLNTKNISSFQIDLGIEVILQLFSKKSIQYIFDYSFKSKTIVSENAQRIFALKNEYLKTIDDVILFLQGGNQTFAHAICTQQLLPQSSRFKQLDDMDWAFGVMGIQDKAKHLATLYIEDLSDFIIECIDSNFGFSRYAERLGRSANTFDELHSNLQTELSYIDTITLRILDDRIKHTQPKLIAFSVPFPGNLYSAFRCAQYIKKTYPNIKIVMGGGFPSTELRSVTDKRVFNFFDYVILDDGELPLELLLQNINTNHINSDLLKRTFLLQNGEVTYINSSLKSDYKHSQVGTPDYSDLLLNKYISVIEIANPMHSLWSDGRWNKLTMAHGCYWGKCAFCDGSLSYIKNFELADAKLLVDRMEQVIAQTGEKGFHFVDEAAPPSLMRDVAIEILKRNLAVTWWTNIRFEKSFTLDMCMLLKASGCIAVSGGLEVASDRMLKLINKGVTVEQVAQVTDNFTQTGIMVHAYLMYGFPTQTEQETVDSLEMVRQMFELGIIQSGFWHQFALTAHSPVGLNASDYGIIPDYKQISFANNDIQFTDKTGIKHDKFSYGLKKSIFNFMHGLCFDYTMQEWFDFKIPKTKIKKDFILNAIESVDNYGIKPLSTVLWIGEEPVVSYFEKRKKGKSKQMLKIKIYTTTESVEVNFDKEKGEWLTSILQTLSVKSNTTLTFGQLKEDFEDKNVDFELFWHSKPIDILRDNGLLVL